jgi:hypothetical protein
VAFNRNSTLPFQVHVIQNLLLHLPFTDGSGAFKQAVGQCGFTMVDVRDNAKIANIIHTDGWIENAKNYSALNIQSLNGHCI